MINRQTVELIQKLMDEQGVSKEELAQKSGVPLATIKRITSGQTDNPYFDTMTALVKALGGSIDQLLYDGDTSAIRQKSSMNQESSYINPQITHVSNAIMAYTEKLSDYKSIYESQIADKDRWLKRLFIACCALVTGVIALLILDIVFPQIGWIRRTVEALFSYI